MTEKILKGINFPGLEGTYKVPTGSYIVKVNLTADEETGEAVYTTEDFNWVELKEAVAANKNVFCRAYDEDAYLLDGFVMTEDYQLFNFSDEENYADFISTSFWNGMCRRVCITSDGSVTFETRDYSNKFKGTLIVTVDKNNITSHSATYIGDHASYGGTVLLNYNSHLYSLLHFTEDYVYFLKHMDDNYIQVFEIFENKLRCYNEVEIVTTPMLNERLGDIETALDSIIAIQEALIGNSTDHITFTFDYDNTICTAEPGMDWETWINSDYNIIGAFLDYDDIVHHGNQDIISLNGEAETAGKAIQDGAVYELL